MQSSSSMNLPTYSCALNFDACSYTYEIPPINLAENRNDIDDYISTKSNRSIPKLKYKSYESILLAEIKAEYLISSQKKEINSGFNSGIISNSSIIKNKPDIDKSTALTKKEMEYNKGNISGNDSSVQESLLKSIIEKAKVQNSEGGASIILQSDINQESLIISISEEILCVNRNNKLEKYEFQGTIGVNHIGSSGGNSSESTHDNDISATVNTMISLVDEKEIINNLKANKSYILTPIQSSGAQQISIENIPKNTEKISPILRYSVVPTFQPFYFRARSKVKVKLPHAKIYVQIILNPIFKKLLDQIDTLSVQASLSCFAFEKDSRVLIRNTDIFNENTKILTWVCSVVDVDKDPIIQLEASIEGSTLMKIIIIFAIFMSFHSCLSKAESVFLMYMHIENSFCDSPRCNLFK
jgi:hypothetical protein